MPEEKYDDQIVELLNKGFMDDPVSTQLWPDPATRELGHRAMFYAHLANQRRQTTSSPSSSSSSPVTSTFINAVIEDDVNEDSIGIVRAASIWTTPEGPKASLNSFYYGFKYLGLLETLKWTKHFLRDFHQVVEEVFDEIIRIRKNKRKSKEKAIESGDGGSEDEGGASEGDKDGSGDGGIVDCGTADGGVADGDGEGQILGFPDFIAADPQIRGQGYGADVMRDGLRRCKEAGATVYIISSNAKNLTFYQKFGFSVHVEKMFKDVPIFGLAPAEI